MGPLGCNVWLGTRHSLRKTACCNTLNTHTHTQQHLIIRKSTRYQNSLEVWDVMLDNNATWTSQRHRSVKLAWQPGKRVFYEEWLMKTWRVAGRLSPHCSCLISLVCSEIMVPLHTVIAVSSGAGNFCLLSTGNVLCSTRQHHHG